MPVRCQQENLSLDEHISRISTLLTLPELSRHQTFLLSVSERALEQYASAEKLRLIQQNPLASCRPSYFQTLKLNSWLTGATFLIDFDCNRGGKTVTSVLRVNMFMCPPPANAPMWKLQHEDNPATKDARHPHQCLPPPAIATLYLLSGSDPLRKLNPNLSHLHPDNLPIFLSGCRLSPLLSHLRDDIDMVTGEWKPATNLSNLISSFDPTRPENLTLEKPLPKHHELWHGSPNHKKFKEACASAWFDWTPNQWIKRYVEHDGIIEIQYPNGLSITVTSKSYDSATNVFASDAVRFILLTEGPHPDQWKEIGIRFEHPALGSWDYTVVEAANINSVAHYAEQVAKGKQPMPLKPIIFKDFGIEFVPSYILPPQKKAEMYRIHDGTPEGEARLYGHFYTTTPRALSNLDRDLHCLPMTLAEVIAMKFSKFDTAPLIRFRGYDEGLDSPSACVWVALAPDQTWYVYRAWQKPKLSIGQRCEEIISLSGNLRKMKNPPASASRVPWSDNDFYYEQIQHPHGERICMTIADYHIFKEDQNTRRTHAMNYVKEGLLLRASITLGPEQRALMLNKLLEPLTLPTISLSVRGGAGEISPASPVRAKIYFLMNEPGVADMVDIFEEWYWEQYVRGEMQGQPKDKVADKNDHLADALSYVVLSPYKWSPTLAASGYGRQYSSNPDRKYFEQLKEYYEDNQQLAIR